MRNLKRVLSLALATVMLLGMLVMNTGAANVNDFSDADQIGNLEAASIVTGLGIFVGDTSGNFDPQRPVTRAEMATIICKILYGSNVNGDNFKGIGTFTDAKTYQGGWAEGYINMCQSQGIVNGYNATTFGAADTVTTWQAALMLQRALGWWAPAAGEAISELSVTGQAAKLALYGDLTLLPDAPLTREDVAVMVFNTLFAQRVHYDDVRGLYTKDNDRNVVVNNGTEDPANTLAQNTFGLQVVDGVVVRNSAVDPDLAATDSNGAMTTVRLDESAVEHDFEYETGVNLIGHAVKVYYTVRNREEIVYAITDHAVVADVITYNSDYGTMNTAAVAAGFKSRSLGDDSDEYYANYDLNTRVKDATEMTAENGNYLVLVSNSANKQVDYAILLNQYLDVMSVSKDINGKTIYEVENYGEDIGLAGKFEDGQLVIVTPTDFNRQNKYTSEFAIVEPAEVVDSTITKITGRSVSSNDYRVITAGGENYRQSPVEENDSRSALYNDKRITSFQAIKELGEATLVLDTYGKLIALDKIVEESIGYVYVSQFGYKYGEISSLKDNIVLRAEVWLPDGTSKIINVNTDVNAEDGTTHKLPSKNGTSQTIIDALTTGSNGSKVLSIEEKYKDLNALDSTLVAAASSGSGANNSGTHLGVYYMTDLHNGTYSLKLPSELNGDGKTYINEADTAQSASSKLAYTATGTSDLTKVRVVSNHNTFLLGTANVTKNGTANDADILYQNRNTVYYYVDGNYGVPGFSVRASVGIANQENFTLEKNPTTAKDATWLEEAWICTPSSGRISVEAVVVHGLNIVEDQGIYYYNEGNYEITQDGDKALLTVYAYDKDGVERSFEYSCKDEAAARSKAKGGLLRDWNNHLNNNTSGIPSGYYTFYTDGMAPKAIMDSKSNYSTGVETTAGSGTKIVVYVADSQARGTDHDRYEYNLYTNATPQGFIYTNARVIDLQGGKYNSVERLYNAMTSRKPDVDPAISNVVVSYSYSRNTYECDVLYLISYSEAGVTPPAPPADDDVQNASELADSISGDTININYVDGDETAYSATKAYLESQGFEMTSYSSTTVKAMDGKVEREFTLASQAWYKVTVDSTLVGYVHGTDGGATAVGVTADLSKGADDKGSGYITNAGDGENYAYAAYGSATASITGTDYHISYEKGYVSVAADSAPAAAGCVTVGSFAIKAGDPSYAKPGETVTFTIGYTATGIDGTTANKKGATLAVADSAGKYTVTSGGSTDITKDTTGTVTVTVTVKLDENVTASPVTVTATLTAKP